MEPHKFEEKEHFEEGKPETDQTPPEVVAAGLAGLDKNHAVVVPGWMNKVTAASTRFAPRSVVRKIAGAIKY